MKLFDVCIDERSREEMFEDIVGRIESSQRSFIVTANALIMLMVRENPQYARVVQSADLVIPDGSGVILLARLRGKKLSRYPGVEMTKDLLKEGIKRGWKFYLLGARKEVVEKLAKDLVRSGVNVCGYHHGYFDGSGPIGDMINKEPDVVLVAMGAPKQEFWIYDNLEKFSKGVFIGVGGTFDVLAGYKKRAPRWMRKLSLEWLYRILQEPRKRWKVFFKLFKFFFYAILDRS